MGNENNTSGAGVNRAKMYQLALFPLNNGATNVYYVLILSYIATFGNNVLGIATVFASVMVTGMRVFDAITDPIIGALMDRTNGKLGKFRPFMIIGNAIMALSVIVLYMITPNIPEAEILAGCSISGEDVFDEIARKLSGNTGVSVLLKAGHLSGDSLVDYFYNAEDGTMTKLPSKRVHTRNTHGTGCTLSSAFAAALAKGEDLTAAAVSAKKYIEQAIISGADYKIGGGHGPVNHFWSME